MNLKQNLRIISLNAHNFINASKQQLKQQQQQQQQQRIVIDFSSPNIAKPFHFGHLKSTILGNFLANLNRCYGNQVTKLNYVGDWGTQYGLLSLGLETEARNTVDTLTTSSSSKSPLEKLLDVYVEANRRGSEDENFYREARRRFQAMDNGQDSEQLSKWRQVRDVSLNELKCSYRRLAVDFDVYEYESDHAKRSHELVQDMRLRGYLNESEDGMSTTDVIKNNKTLGVPLLKSDGSSLYMTRDIVAALHRKEKYGFDRMYYVVGSDQEKHFHCLKEIVKKLGNQWADDLVHVKIGKVVGMSSRSGNAVLLSKIIDEATEVYMESTRNVPTSRVSDVDGVEEVGKQLALSALFVYDMKNKRTRNYEFNWNQVMLPGERSGINLQTTYARLCSLFERANIERGLLPYESAEEINYDSISCVEGVNLIGVINELGIRLSESYELLDPSPLVNHALYLCRATNRARRSDKLNIKYELDDHIARSRLTLFESARSQLELIIKLIGLQPLKKV